MPAWQFSRDDLEQAIAASDCWASVLRALGLRVAGGNHATVKRWAERWRISTGHFDANEARRRAQLQRARPLAEVLVAGSHYNRASLKRRLYDAGLKSRACELCGQSEYWRGQRIALILDRINGDATDHRLGNLRIVCPNCAAALDTHCGKNKKRKYADRACEQCAATFRPRYAQHRFCSVECAVRARGPRPTARKAARPPVEQLVRDVQRLGYAAVGRRYGVSDNAIRKWIRASDVQAVAGLQGPHVN